MRGKPCECTVCEGKTVRILRFIPKKLLELRDIIIITSSTAMAQCRATVLYPAFTLRKRCNFSVARLQKRTYGRMLAITCAFFHLDCLLCTKSLLSD